MTIYTGIHRARNCNGKRIRNYAKDPQLAIPQELLDVSITGIASLGAYAADLIKYKPSWCYEISPHAMFDTSSSGFYCGLTNFKGTAPPGCDAYGCPYCPAFGTYAAGFDEGSNGFDLRWTCHNGPTYVDGQWDVEVQMLSADYLGSTDWFDEHGDMQPGVWFHFALNRYPGDSPVICYDQFYPLPLTLGQLFGPYCNVIPSFINSSGDRDGRWAGSDEFFALPGEGGCGFTDDPRLWLW